MASRATAIRSSSFTGRVRSEQLGKAVRALDEDARKQIEKLRDDTQADSLAEVIRRALCRDAHGNASGPLAPRFRALVPDVDSRDKLDPAKLNVNGGAVACV